MPWLSSAIPASLRPTDAFKYPARVMKPLTVNEALARLSELGGSCILLEGVLTYEFEDISISHWPKAEWKDVGSNVEIEPYSLLFPFNGEVMKRWCGKRVVILGVIEGEVKSSIFDYLGGFEHSVLWPARIRVRRIDLRKRWLKEHPEYDDVTGQHLGPM